MDFEGQKHTSFVNGYSIALTTETSGEMDLYKDTDGDYLKVDKMVTYDGTKREIDFTRVLAEAKSKGYKIKKSEPASLLLTTAFLLLTKKRYATAA